MAQNANSPLEENELYLQSVAGPAFNDFRESRRYRESSRIPGENLRLDLRALEYVAHWVTPAGQRRRYDTRFFVAVAPAAQLAAHDANETVADEWIRPVDALERGHRHEFQLLPPTIRNLEAIAEFANTAAVVAFARALREIPRIEPRVVERDGRVAIVMPGDVGYDDDPVPSEEPRRT